MRSTLRMVGISFLIFSAALRAEFTLIAPMVEGLNACKSAAENLQIMDGNAAVQYCKSKNESAATLLEDELMKIGPKVSADGQFGLGYTLNMPLLSYIEVANDEMNVNRDLIKQDLQLLSDSDRKVVLYLFANHFVSGGAVATAEALSKDPGSVMQLADGSVPGDKYFDTGVIPWSLGNAASKVRQAKTLAMNAVIDEVCHLPQSDIDKIHAATTLGETHHMFPNFKSGMGYGETYKITDYSAYSVDAFQQWLKAKYGRIESLNAKLQSQYESFSQIVPPSKNIKTDKLNSFFEHIDPYAHGSIPFLGWAYDKTGKDFEILAYLNGQYVGDAAVGMTRLDVAQSIPELDDSNVGYRYDLDFSSLPPGVHVVELRFFQDGKTSLLKKYSIAVMDRRQSEPEVVEQHVLVSVDSASTGGIRFWADHPKDLIALFYNPLARLWNDFREQQVTSEIEFFAQILESSCLGKERIFSAQIGSMYNATWNPHFFAADDSLKKNSHYSLGVNLYGGVVYGDFLFNWLAENQHTKYGIPEMHPMTLQEPVELVSAIRRHQRYGAWFISPYFMSVKPDRFGLDPEHEKYRVSAENHQWGSAEYFQALKIIMNTPAQ
ncbi:MAG: beta-galactosidase [Hahellaceae bacterium]|nr:beta-galactosidase [Hahellaceae bacterium]MCP5211306.1 beta-galactosidase [Hahellaceae bacterium]